MKQKYYILLVMIVCVCAGAYAQTDTIRYVRTTGAYNNDGRSWATAKNRVQDAINDLHEYLQDNGLHSGSVYIAAGTYTPTESTESSGGSMLHTSFKIYEGIHVYGGFDPTTPEERPGLRIMSNDKTCEENWADPSGIGVISGTVIASQWDLKHKTILTGNHSSTPPTFTFDSIRGKYNTTYPASSYHVVWFATNGKYTTTDDALKDHYKPLPYPASLDGCVISSGNAGTRSTTLREHTAYGGGVYMVGNTYMRNCIVERCNATLRGGGIYADGGGVIEFCYIHTCQSAGVGVVEGYGGGVCIDQEGSIGHSQITSCAARCGGGLLICHENDDYPWAKRVEAAVLGAADTITSWYSPYATACVINNNTANAEGGGIYLAEGGTVNHCTVTGNNCCSADVTYYGRRHGRSGGVYVRNCGMLFNSVFWGNRCDVNNDIQFASVRQKSGDAARGFEIFAYHTAFMNHDITDWTGVTKDAVYSLDKRNLPVKGSPSNHPCFFHPTVDPNNWDSVNTEAGIYGAGVMMHMRPVDYPGPRIWHLTTYSALDQKGVQWNPSVQGASPWLIHAHTDYGVVSNPYEPVSTLGALVRRPDPLTYELIVPQSAEYRKSTTPIPTLFVDPNRAGVYDEDGNFVPQPKEGDSWNVPIKDLGEAISFFRQYLVADEANRENHHYMIPALDGDGMPTGEPQRYDYVQILVKEGTLTTVGPGNYLDRNIRTAAVRMESHMRMYGGYPSSLTGTDTEGRNPREYKSIITSNITGKTDAASYANNSAHVIAMVNCEHTIVDGFTLSDANTHNVDLSLSAHAGGGLLLNNASTPENERINMTGNQLRNSVITNCSSPKGAAVYVNGEWPRTGGEICYAELMLVNCVIRNNTADYTDDGVQVNDHGIITANGRAYVHAEHCTVVNNVGFPFKAESKDIETDEPVHCGHPEHAAWSPFHGYIRVNNSIVFCNSDRSVENHSNLGEIANVMSVNADGQDYVFGKYNMFDADIVLHKSDIHQPRGFFQDGFTVPENANFLPDGISSHFVDDIHAIPADSADRANKCIFTRDDNTKETYPTFVNPSRNVGHSTSGDKPLYGGVVAYSPLTTNPCVNAGGRDEYTTYYDCDRSDVTKRDRGGAPDVGAIENTDLPAAGSVIYVTPDGAGKRDGSSWDNAIAGNTIYALYGAGAAGTDQLDTENGTTRIINTDPLIGTGEANGVTTDDDRYKGGFARKYEYTMSRDIVKTHTTSKTRNIYEGGNNDHIDTIPGESTNNTVTGTWYTDGIFWTGYDPTVALNSAYPYGEMSGASRSIYRANDNFSPIDDAGSDITTYDGKNLNTLAASGQVILRNERKENYVSGLQYAVEMASMRNKAMHKDSIQVWVGAGKYTDYKGYVMRDSVSVYGGFPAGKFSAPGMNERRALMSKVVAIPKSKENNDLDAKDYETILQISDVNPKTSNTAINTAAIKFYDNGPSIKWQFNKYTYDTVTNYTNNYYRWEYTGSTDASTYILYPDMYLSGATDNNVFASRNKSNKDGSKKVDNITMGNEEFGGIKWTSGQKVVYQFFGPKNVPNGGSATWPYANGNKSWELVYEDRSNNINWKGGFHFKNARTVVDAEGNSLGTVPRGMDLGGVMNTMSVWQTMKNVPAGTYQLQIDLGAYYVNYVDETNTGITFYIIDANGDIVAEQPIYRNNNQLVRYFFEFEQPSDGDLTVRIMSSPGTKTDDPPTGDFGPNADESNLNYRRVSMANVLLYSIDPEMGEYVLDHTGYSDESSRSIKVTATPDDKWRNVNRTTLRKRVLTMPDVANPVFGHGLGDPKTRGKKGDSFTHFERVIKESRKSNNQYGKINDPNYKEYNEVYWDGFTIRHGFIYDQCMAHGGGAGVNMYEGGHLVNCIVTDNWAGAMCIKGGGVFCDGSNSTIENCFILNNTSTKGTQMAQDQEFAGGLFLYEGTCFNTLIANNYAHGFGGGLGLCVGKFYNNTVAYNHGEFYNSKSGNKKVGGLRIASGAASSILIANSILYGNNGLAADMTDNSDYAPFLHCYIQSEDAITKKVITHAINEHTKNNDGNYGVNNTFYNGEAASAATTPFAADVVNGKYDSSNPGAKRANDFALRQVTGIHCINSGTEDFAASLEEALAVATESAIPSAKRAGYREAVAGVELPANDVVYAKRVQDCQVDIGAYEYNAAYNISPDTTTHPGKAIYYITYDAHGGDASANSPDNAACKQKLQLVLDAAGRFKNQLKTAAWYNKGSATEFVSNEPNKYWDVEVWLEGDDEGSTTTNTYAAWYTPTRSTRHSEDTYQDNTLDYSFMVPHGVHLKGGYTVDFYHYEKGGEEVAADAEGAHIVDDRDALTYRTVLSGNIESSTGAKGQTYHVVTFVNDLFSADDEKIIGDGKQLAVMTDERDRAVLDGLFIMDGKANAPDEEGKNGGACIVTDFAHVRNCVIQNNTADAFGGGLYLKPKALVSGTIIKNNTAKVGGGMYIEKPTDSQIAADSIARVFYSTICENTGRSSAGGLFFDNTYARVNSSAIWHNNANDNANVAGNFARSYDTVPYPLNFCAVESRRLEGQGNIDLSPKETEGVRWDRQDPFDAILYYPLEMSSTLARAGLTYTEWDNAYAIYTTLDSMDIAGVSRKRWYSDGSPRGFAWGSDTLVYKNNDVIDIGARAINKNFEVRVDPKYVMHRLFVIHTELIDSKAARALQDNTNTDSISNMYRQMGSCILNPFHRLDDALSYVIKARKMDSTRYRNTRFEIFLEQGTYYPFHNAYGEQGAVRLNTFLVPEAVLIVGGVDSRPSDHKYGQSGFSSPFSTVHSIGDGKDVVIPGTGYTINDESTDNIRLRDATHRPMRDNNLNSVIEPWELERQTILSGNAVAGEDFTHVYHVVTCHANEDYIGPRPLKYRTDSLEAYKKRGVPALQNPIGNYKKEDWHEECDLSVLARTVGFDGVQITGGYANHVDSIDAEEVYVQKTYFRGGGIFVDGNWDKNIGTEAVNMTDPSAYNLPIVVENCYFTNNMAGNGGAIYSNSAIYAYGNRFTQNYSQGPMTPRDQKYIPWTAGGCIATNHVCDVSNTLFDNNEARRGLYPIDVPAEEHIPDADARQGFGGCLSVAGQASMRVVNCHFMKNKAVAYSAIYNFLANNRYSSPDSMQFAFNSIFWGNEVFEVDNIGELDHVVPPSQEEIDAFETKYKASRAGVFHYDGDEWDTYERLFHEYDSLYNHYAAEKDTFNSKVTGKLAELRAQGNKMEGLYFCSYRKGYGPSSMKPTSEGYLLTQAEQRAWQDPRSRNVKIVKNENDDIVEDYTDMWTQVSGNNNTLINRINTATDGPNFKQPTFVAGIDGYMQNADWLQARMNITTDQGWGHLKQTVGRDTAYYITKYTEKEQFDTRDLAWEAIKAIDGADYWKDIYAILGLPSASFKPAGEQSLPGAMYNYLAKRYGAFMSATNAPLPVGDQYYMTYTRSTSDSETSGRMDRISKSPKIGVEDVYIDLGIYEYQYVQLDIKGNEIDTVWVATKTKDPIRHDGLTWETPTTDLQSAIDLLMSSHNNHDKYVCLMGDDEGGTFSPHNVLDNRRAFVISSNANAHAVLLPDSALADYDYGVNSITFLGGYSYSVKNAKRDPVENPTVIEMPDAGNENQRNQLIIIEDMTRQMLQANFVGEYTSRDSVVIPIVFDGITFINPYSVKEPSETDYSSLGGSMSKKGGAAIYYRWQRRYDDDGTSSGTPNFKMALHPDSALIDGAKVTLPKLTISNCTFMDNGKRTALLEERSPAVRIDHGGGSSLIVNSLFHSNAGAPVYARSETGGDLATVPNDVVMVNVTSALNEGHIRLESDHSEVHNSLIWLDDLSNDTTVQLQMGADKWDKAANKNREGIAGRMSYNAVWGCFQAFEETGDSQHNHPLGTENKDIFKGPGFLSPFITATTSEQRRERSFRLNPSLRTHDMASDTVYTRRVFFRVYPDKTGEKIYWRRSNGFKDATITSPVTDFDLAFKPRQSGEGMERGAYECLAVLQRVLYVDPLKPEYSAGDGSNWENAFGQGQIQNAIDAAAVYTYLYQNLERESRKAYVFVKGTGEATVHYSLEARDGVSVFGSVPRSFNDTAFADPDLKKFTDSECHRFVNYVRAASSGVIAPNNAAQTRINSIHVTGDDYETGFLIDGFVITNPGVELTASPVLLDNTLTAMRNCLVTDNTLPDHPIADVRRGLLYNCLFYNDSAETIVKVGANGLVLNNTIVADNGDVAPLDTEEAAEGAVQNNIALNTALAPADCFAPYMTSGTPYTLPAYLTANTPLAYQLHERSSYINAGTTSLPALFNSFTADNTINFNRDRDMLGNPRKIGASIDKGALETWYVAENQAQEITALTNKLIGRQASLDADDATRDAAFTTHYGGNAYPHPGSVVYLMDSAVLSMQYATADDFKDFKSNVIIFRPGYMLFKPGASFYGNGHDVQLGYVAVEKRFTNQRYSMTALPFNYSTANITTAGYSATAGVLDLRLYESPSLRFYQYSGAARSEKDYAFQPSNSSVWLPVDTLNRTATNGYLMDFGATTDTVLRFNGFAAESGEYVYTEDRTDKTVYLTQYDNRTAGTGADMNFTRQEDMGWNMKGLPWLVSTYRTDTILWEDNYLRQMYIPHVLYQMDGAGSYVDEGDKILTTQSWKSGSTVSMGNAFFTQTATTKERENVIFHLPKYLFNEPAARPILRLASRPKSGAPEFRRSDGAGGMTSDILMLYPDSTAAKNVRYAYGRDGIKWISNQQSAQVYMMDAGRQSRISLLGNAPTEVDIPLGVQIPGERDFTFSLPEKDAFADYAYVWLIDYQLNRYTNLLEKDYDVELGAGENNKRFAVRIGGFPKTGDNGKRQYVVFTYDGTLYVRGVVPGDKITVYAPSGQIVCSAVANSTEWSKPLVCQAGYVVKVNDYATKVLNR